MNPTEEQRTLETTGLAGTGQTSVGANSGGDMLDKGVNAGLQKAGHAQKPGMTEKVQLKLWLAILNCLDHWWN